MYDIYEERIKHAPEIYGAINTNYLSLDEYVLVYHLKQHKLRRPAEIKMIEFIASLKYYVKIWPRAKTFANLLGLLQYGESQETESSTHA